MGSLLDTYAGPDIQFTFAKGLYMWSLGLLTRLLVKLHAADIFLTSYLHRAAGDGSQVAD